MKYLAAFVLFASTSFATIEVFVSNFSSSSWYVWLPNPLEHPDGYFLLVPPNGATVTLDVPNNHAYNIEWTDSVDYSGTNHSALLTLRDGMEFSIHDGGEVVVDVPGSSGVEYTSDDLIFTLLLAALAMWAFRSGIQDGSAV